MTSKTDDVTKVEALHAIDKVHKELSEEAIRHKITTAKMMYKIINDDITNICSTGCKPKSWELNYPALTFIMNGAWWILCGLCKHNEYYGFTSNASHNKG